MKSMNQWLDEYAVSHQNPVNKLIHWFCVPVILFTIIGLLWSIPTNPAWGLWGNPGVWGLVFINAYYLRLSALVFAGTLPQSLLMAWILHSMTAASLAVTTICIVLFVIAWVFQFIGHAIEGRKPSFAQDIQFLMIGPAWVTVALLKKLNLYPNSTGT